MEINWLTVIATIINFGILNIILKHFLYKPVTETINSRELEIIERIKKSEEAVKTAEALKMEHEEKIKKVYEEEEKIINESKYKAVKLSDEIINKAKEEADNILERARKDAERERQKAEDDIKAQAVNLAILLSSKALEKELDEEEHRRLINEYINEVGV
ncbi:ATP synthase F0 subcomplex B subunit [Clostridium sp. USBA 49]|uniref:F0F1 ATP synthase subunit B n=1 Tax=Clostridium sp. USBA 49 TaxID=1881060 RepID=UPI000999C4B7|nr:F0F1 ATP synthase subunit B [Clostridium sp. USBA 49]SKA83800.1 ATP synthase F0 subcomplex B subunit [Clostridium sp. USBA 49]